MNFAERYKKLLDFISDHRVTVLSTSLNDVVTSRMISVIGINGKFYFQTDSQMEKYTQIVNNANVSLCFDNISIQGTCKTAGVPADNKDFCDLYAKYFRNAYDLYTHLDNEVLLEITPSVIKLWSYEDNCPYREVYNITDKTYLKQKY